MDKTFSILTDYNALIASLGDVAKVLEDDASHTLNVAKMAIEHLIAEHSKINSDYHENYFKNYQARA